MNKTQKIMMGFGVTSRYKGYHFVNEAVEMMRANEDDYFPITKCVYPEIAKKYNTNIDCVERNIRTVINRCWKNNAEAMMDIADVKLFRRPSNDEFIRILAAYINDMEE